MFITAATAAPYLKYLPGFNPLGTHVLNVSIRDDIRRSTTIPVDMPKGVTEKTKAISIWNWTFWVGGENADSFSREEVLLTDNGMVLLWTATYVIRKEENSKEFVATRSTFVKVDDDLIKRNSTELGDQAREWNKILYSVMTRISNALREGVVTRNSS